MERPRFKSSLRSHNANKYKESIFVESKINFDILKYHLKDQDVKCKLEYVDEEQSMLIEAKTEEAIQAAKQLVDKLLPDIKQKKKELSPVCVVLLKKKCGEELLNNFLCEEGIQWYFDDPKTLVIIGTNDESYLTSSFDDIIQRISHEYNKNFSSEMAGLVSQEVTQFRNEDKLLVQFIITNNSLKITGDKEDVKIAKKKINYIINSASKDSEEELSVKGPKVKFIKKYRSMLTDLTNLFSGLENKILVNTDDELTYKVSDKKLKIAETSHKFAEFLQKIEMRETNCGLSPTDLYLVAKTEAQDKTVSRKLADLDFDRDFLVQIDIENLQDDDDDDSTAVSKKEVAQNCTVEIVNAEDITREEADVLVCPINEGQHLSKRTAVLKAFERVCDDLMDDLVSQYHTDSSQTTFITTNNGNLKCKAVVFVMMKIFDSQDISASVHYLEQQICKALDRAGSLKAETISLPVLGCGKLFNYPMLETAQSAMNGIKFYLNNNATNTLKRIRFLVSEPNLQDEYQKCLSSSFKDTTYSDQSAVITIISKKGADFDDLQSEVQEKLREICCGTEDFTQEEFVDWPQPSIHDDLVQKAKSIGVVIEKLSASPNGKMSYKISGPDMKRRQILNDIRETHNSIKGKFPTKQIKNIKCARGSVEFLKEACESDDKYPSYWSVCSVEVLLGNKQIDNPSNRVTLDDKTTAFIKSAVDKLFVHKYIGHGNDGRNLNYSTVNVERVERVENVKLYNQYHNSRREMIKKMMVEGQVCSNIANISSPVETLKSSGTVTSTSALDHCMKSELLFSEVNEHYLFHGCSREKMNEIVTGGFDLRVANDKGMFGKGLYFAENPTKADQYAGELLFFIIYLCMTRINKKDLDFFYFLRSNQCLITGIMEIIHLYYKMKLSVQTPKIL